MIIAVDTGGTKTLVGKFDDTGYLLESIKYPTPKDVDQYCHRFIDQVRLITGNTPVTIISLGLPGVVRDGVAVWSHNLDWHNVAIRDKLQLAFPSSLVFVENDANLAGLASMRRLQPTPRCGLYITIGTGIGTSIILDGNLHQRLRDCEGGHMMLRWGNQELTWESLASGKALNQLFGPISDDMSAEVWLEIAKRINAGLRVLVPFVQPDTVVIGGGIGKFTDHFGSTLGGLLAESLPASIPCPSIVSAPYPEQTVLYGCYDHALSYIQSN